MELLDVLVDQGHLVHQAIEVTLDQRDLMERKELQEIRGLLGLRVNQAIKEALALLVWWELMDHLVLRYVAVMIKHKTVLFSIKRI